MKECSSARSKRWLIAGHAVLTRNIEESVACLVHIDTRVSVCVDYSKGCVGYDAHVYIYIR